MIPIVACTIGSPCVSVMKASIEAYSPETKFLLHEIERSSFGESYNTAMDKAFETYDEIIIANDDVVLTPTTIPKLLEDVEKLKKELGKNSIGFVASLVDNGRLCQNVRLKFFGDQDVFYGGKWKSESVIKQTPVIAPIFAYISKYAFSKAKFPPINWYSDDLICYDMEKAGLKHFISTSYIHHVGSSTIGEDYDKLSGEAITWIKKNRPEFLFEIEKRKHFKQW